MQPSTDSSQEEQKKIGAIMLTLMWLGIFAIMGIFFSGILDKQNNPNQSVQTLSLAGNVKELVLQRNRMGHYVANGSINNQAVTFMLDTGATDVSIPASISRKLNLTPGPTATYQTANGTVDVRLTKLETVSLGDISLHNVRATINPGYKSNEILLGMSFLKHLEFSQRGNTLTLRQYPEGFKE
ncbi:MAG: TIGR02281 family clan AA aspartic protease [Gammaproteobacteria bacterium]|nr:TIGR02281 family clan AA aspartic protease [Gammaproteobacteria bacterium]